MYLNEDQLDNLDGFINKYGADSLAVVWKRYDDKIGVALRAYVDEAPSNVFHVFDLPATFTDTEMDDIEEEIYRYLYRSEWLADEP